MFRRLLAVTAMFMLAASAGCAPSTPLWREQARAVLDTARVDGADKVLPAEFQSVQETYNQGEAILREDEVAEADECFRLAWLKGELLATNFTAEKMRRAEAERRIRQEELEAQTLRDLSAVRRPLREKSENSEARIKAERPKQAKERPQQAHHTVKRGETLPLIAAEPEVYNDYRLWPLLYRANRDQISDPKHIWPGQVLRIPRNMSRDEITEARRYALEKPI